MLQVVSVLNLLAGLRALWLTVTWDFINRKKKCAAKQPSRGYQVSEAPWQEFGRAQDGSTSTKDQGKFFPSEKVMQLQNNLTKFLEDHIYPMEVSSTSMHNRLQDGQFIQKKKILKHWQRRKKVNGTCLSRCLCRFLRTHFIISVSLRDCEPWLLLRSKDLCAGEWSFVHGDVCYCNQC
ncbi:unnamed protein product [Urochloa humidicola]